MKNEKNENIAIIVGFVLILFVIIFTLFRNNLFSANDKSTNNFGNQSDKNQADSPAYATISASDLNKKIILNKDKETPVLLDIRSFDTYIQEHIVDAINIPLDEFPVSSKIDTRSPIVIIGESNTDKNISLAMDKLKQEKYENIVVLAGGMALWKQLVGATVTYGDPKSFVDQSKVAYLDPPSLNDAIQQKVPVYIVDVRSADEYAQGHIEGAKNIPFEELEKRRSEITEKKIVVVGTNELQEFQAAVQMYDMLLASPFVMRTAIPGWQEKGFALVK